MDKGLISVWITLKLKKNVGLSNNHTKKKNTLQKNTNDSQP